MTYFIIGVVECETRYTFNKFGMMMVRTADSEDELLDAIKASVQEELNRGSDKNILINYIHYEENGKKLLRIENADKPDYDYIIIEYGHTDGEPEIETKTYPEGEVSIKKCIFEGKTIGFTATKDGNIIYTTMTMPSGSAYSSDPYDRRKLDGISDEKIDYLLRNKLLWDEGNYKGLLLLEFEYKDKPTNQGRNRMGCLESWYDPTFSITQTFTKGEIEKMTEKEVNDLWKLAGAIAEGLY